MSDDFIRRLPSHLRETVRTAVPLRDLTTLRVGGAAAWVCPVRNPDQARWFQNAAAESFQRSYVLGHGSNVLGDDAGFGGAVLQVRDESVVFRGDTAVAGAGVGFDDLIASALRHGLTGLEFASGIPGTLGGALAGNAGCYGHEIGEFLREAVILRPDGTLETVGPEAFGFSYRATDLREAGAMVLTAVLQLQRGDAAAAGDERDAHLADRRRKHPVDLPCAGSWFRNLPPLEPGGRRRAAGQLLEAAGAKAMREGDAGVFERHANIIVNLGAASSADIRRLVERMRGAVREKFGEELIEEVRHLADAPSG